MQSSAHNTSNLAGNNHLNTSATLASLGDYSMQMNDLINDDNGDGLDMTFWENFDNFNYDADLVMSNNNSNSNSSSAQQYSQLLSKSSNKRSFDGTASDRKRKRGINETMKGSSMHSKSIPKDLLAKSNSSNSVSPAPTPMDTVLSSSSSAAALSLSKSTTINLSQNKKSSINATSNAATIVPSHSNSSITIDLDASKSEVICIEDDEDDATNNNNTGGHCCVNEFCKSRSKRNSSSTSIISSDSIVLCNIQYDFNNTIYSTHIRFRRCNC